MTVAEAEEAWLRKVQTERRERSTLDQYRQYVTIHINPRLGREKVARLTTPRIGAFKDDLLASKSRALAKKVLVSLKSMLRVAQRSGGVAQNVALSVKIMSDKRDAQKLKSVWTSRARTKSSDCWQPQAASCVHCSYCRFRGPASELRGLRWEDVDLSEARCTCASGLFNWQSAWEGR